MKFLYVKVNGSEEVFRADSWDAARQHVQRAVKRCVHDPEGCTLIVYLQEVDDCGSPIGAKQSVRVEVPPNERYLVEQVGGDPSCNHEWSHEGEGGCAEMPGLYAIGGSAILSMSHCVRCGVRKHLIFGDTRPGRRNKNGVRYLAPLKTSRERRQKNGSSQRRLRPVG